MTNPLGFVNCNPLGFRIGETREGFVNCSELDYIPNAMRIAGSAIMASCDLLTGPLAPFACQEGASGALSVVMSLLVSEWSLLAENLAYATRA